MKERLLDLLQNTKKALDIREIEEALDLDKSAESLKELIITLNNLEEDLIVHRTNKNRYELFSNNTRLKIGTLVGTKGGYAFVHLDGEDNDIYINEKDLNHAVHNDKVIVEIINPLEKSGRILKILERNVGMQVGEIIEGGYVKLDESRLHIDIKIPKNNLKGTMPGHKVLLKVGKKLKDNLYEGEIVKILGHKNAPGVDILSIVYKYGINDTFSDEIMEEVAKLPDHVEEEEISNRTDFRDKMIFTIDGDDTKDIDDAISLEKLENGNVLLGVHIADVSYYVKPGMKTYDEALDRGTSVYLADRVIPMLPRKLSNGICSLNPGVDRLTISCMMQIDNNGNVVDSEILESVIRSRKQMTYKNVNLILEKDEVPSGYEEFVEPLKDMYELTQKLRKKKIKNGYIDFDIDEAKIIVDDEGKAIDIKKRYRGIGENMIEDFMIIANETVAETIYYMSLPFIYRVHGTPDEEKIRNFLTFVGSLGCQVNADLKELTPKTIQSILSQLKDMEQYGIISSLMLRCMQKAVYDYVNTGHFGLASKCYTHFTSPIRRFPDTTVHRLLRMYLFKHKMDPMTIKYLEHELPIIAKHSSEKERASVDCERDVDKMKMAEYMESKIGECYNGMVSGVIDKGLFIQLPNLVEGLISVEDLPKDNYIYDESTMTLLGKNRGYRLGDKLDIIVSNASKETHTVDFVLDTKENRKIYQKVS